MMTQNYSKSSKFPNFNLSKMRTRQFVSLKQSEAVIFCHNIQNNFVGFGHALIPDQCEISDGLDQYRRR